MPSSVTGSMRMAGRLEALPRMGELRQTAPDGATEGAREGAPDLTDERWLILEPLIPKPKPRVRTGRGTKEFT